MPRFRRVTPPGSIQHVISRYVNREIRVTEPGQRARYIWHAERAMRFTDWTPLAFAIMGNHNHWACVAGKSPLRSFFHPLNSAFASWLNDSQGRPGPLFASRPRNISLTEERTAYLIAYIHNNPVRAELVNDAANSAWTTHRMYIGDVHAPAWLDVERGLSLCGFSASSSGRVEFHDFVRSRAGDPRDPTISGDGAEEVQRDVREVLGTDLELAVSIDRERAEYGIYARPMAPLRAPYRGSVSTVISTCARGARVSVDELRSRSRRRDIVNARRLVLVTWCIELGRRQSEIAAVLGLSESAASRLLAHPRAAADLRARARALAWRIRRGCD